MKKIVLFSTDINILQRWLNILAYDKEKITILYTLEDLIKTKDSIVILDINSCQKEPKETILVLVNNNNQLLALDRLPTLLQANEFLTLGVMGYGNSAMSPSYLNSAIEALENNMMWIAPNITTELISKYIKEENIIIHDNNEIISLLSSREQEIANLILQGKSNNDISYILDISVNTLKSHIKKIYDKLQVKDRLSFTLLFK